MTYRFRILLANLLTLLLAHAQLHAQVPPPSVLESEREIPIAYKADIVVVGGTTGAVSAAIAAAKQGASVFLAAPRPYLGEDVCGTLQMWLNPDEQPRSDLEKKLFDVAPRQQLLVGRIPFTYEADQRSDSKHADSAPPSRLTDGRWGSAANDSVQFNQDVTLLANLGRSLRVKELHLLVYQRSPEFEVAEMQVWTSPNGKIWRDLGVVKNEKLSSTSHPEDQAIDLTLSIKQPCSFVKVLVRKTARADRMLLGELVIIDDQAVVENQAARQPPTPMQIKYGLDQALIEAGVQFLYGAPVTEIVQDRQGKLAGVVIANRAGRQVIQAKVVIDASLRATAARIAQAPFQPFTAGLQTFERVVVSGQPRAGEGLSVEKVGVQFASQEGLHDVYHYRLNLPLKDNTFASYAEAEQQARDLTFDVELVDESECVYHLPTDPIVAKSAPISSQDFDPETVSLEVCQPKDFARLFVLSGYAGVSRPAAAALMRPLNLMRLGERIGVAAAQEATALPAASDLTVAGSPAAAASSPMEVREFLEGIRPTDKKPETILSPARNLPVLGEYDVVVIGGGTGGAPAAIGAGRRGSKTLLVEYQDHLGGVGTLGLITSYYFGYRKGFSAEVDQGVEAMNGPKRKGGWNPITKREYWREEVRKAGCDLWFSTIGCGAVVNGNFVSGVVVATPLGRGVVLAKTVIDSTGNADIAAAAGAETITTSAEHVAMQGTGLSPRALATGYMNTDYSFSDESDPVDQWRMIVTARRKYKNSYDLSTFIDSRERRRIVGEVFITPLDLINGRTYSDTISMHQSNFDTHGYTVHPIFLINFPDKKQMTVPVPYRALLPKNLDGILVTGLGISAHRDSMPILRMQACIQNQGYAAGVAASMAAELGASTRSVDLRALQEHLVDIGSLDARVLEQQNSAPPTEAQVAAAISSVVQEYQGLSLLLEQKTLALPLLREAYAAASNPEHKLVYANILGMLGDPTGNQTLIEIIQSSSWDAGWNFRGMGQFGGSISRLDSYLIALGKSGDVAALPTLLEKLSQLDASKEFSHHRAVAMALESLADPRAAQPLAELLQKDGMTGFAMNQVNADTKVSGEEQRSEPLREIILARALYRCGDHEGLGQRILQAYSTDLRGLFAKHALAVLDRSRTDFKLETK